MIIAFKNTGHVILALQDFWILKAIVRVWSSIFADVSLSGNWDETLLSLIFYPFPKFCVLKESIHVKFNLSNIDNFLFWTKMMGKYKSYERCSRWFGIFTLLCSFNFVYTLSNYKTYEFKIFLIISHLKRFLFTS